MSGWIKLHRQFLEWEWYDDINVKTLFMHFLLKANYEAKKYRGYDILPGQVVVGVNALSKQTGLSVSQVRTAIDKLQMTNEIAIKPTNKFSIITITCWNEYQVDSNQNRDQTANGSQTDRNQIATPKEGKKEKKVEKHIDTRVRTNVIDWKPNSESFEIGKKEGYSDDEIEWTADSFISHHTAQSTERENWDHTFNGWLRQDITRKNIISRRKSKRNNTGKRNRPNKGFAKRALDVAGRLDRIEESYVTDDQ